MRAYNNWYLSIFDKINNVLKNTPKISSCEFKRVVNTYDYKIIVVFDDVLSFNVVFSDDNLKIYVHENTLADMLYETEILDMNTISLNDSDETITMYANIILCVIMLHAKEFNDRKIS